MLRKCANPSCSTPLLYLREGKIFRMEHPPTPEPVNTPLQGKKMPPARVEHFWLCGPCSAAMTLVHDSQAGVLVLPKSHKKARAMRAAC